MGGVAADQLAKMLKSSNIPVKLLVTVDAAWGPKGQPLQIPDNVQTDYDYFQTNPSFIFSHGYPAKPMDGNDKTTIVNTDMTDKTSGKGSAAHGTMADDTQKDATKVIQSSMSNKPINTNVAPSTGQSTTN